MKRTAAPHPARTVLLLGLVLSVTAAPPAHARPNLDGPAIVVGFHVVPPGPGEVLPFPRTPAELRPAAISPGLYDVWLFVLTRAPLVGAWTLDVGLNYDGFPGRGIDILAWESFADQVRPSTAWPTPGAGNGAGFVWNRARCWEPHRLLLEGVDGWWVQAACRLRVQAWGPDSLTLADPEPGVRPVEVECLDEGHDLDGTDNWTGVVPALFGEGEGGDASARPGRHGPSGPSAPGLPRLLPMPLPEPTIATTWSRLKHAFRAP